MNDNNKQSGGIGGVEWPIGLRPGIYFGLPDEAYHTDPAISRTDIMRLLRSPAAYWRESWMNLNRARRQNVSPDMEYGEQLHMLLFQREEFDKKYQIIPGRVLEPNKKPIAHEKFMAMVESATVLRSAANVRDALSSGWAEVTIVFEHCGILFRTRHDYFTPTLTIDYKTTSSLETSKLKWSFSQYGYDIQMALYLKARREFRRQYAAGKAHVYGQPDKALFRKFIAAEDDGLFFIFQDKLAPYPFRVLVPESDTEDTGAGKIDDGLKVFLTHLSRHGSKPWPVSTGEFESFSMYYGVSN
jgi:hypothetical protein